MLIAWRDYVADSTFTEITGSWSAGAPLDNVKLRQLGITAVASDNLKRSFKSTFDLTKRVTDTDGAQVGLVSILNHNLPFEHAVAITLLDTGASPIIAVPPALYWIPLISEFPKNIHFVVGSLGAGDNIPGVGGIQLDFYPTPDPDGQFGDPTPYPLQIGRVWAGPVFAPTYKTMRSDFTLDVIDDSVINRSMGQQVYADYKPRYRRLNVSTILTETEAIGTEDGRTISLEDISFEVGRAGEVIVLPSISSNQVMHKFGVYGHFDTPPSLVLTEVKGTRHYSASFAVIEDR